MVTSSRQINFWGQKAGASEAVLAREIPSAELFKMPEILEIPAEVLVYGASVIHHSKRPLLQNYYNFTHIDDERLASVTSSWLSQVTQRATIPFLKTIMVPISLPITTLI